MERELILNSLLSLHNDVREILTLLKGGSPAAGGRWGRLVEITEAEGVEPRDLDEIEREAIQQALVANGGNRRKAAKQLGISERTLYRRLKEYGLG
jgi:DNA-binding NtrC family response regulator